MAKKTKKIVIPVYTKKAYLECDGQFIELGEGNIEIPTTVEQEEETIVGNIDTSPNILSCEIRITLKTFISFQSYIYVKHHNAFALIPTKDLVWNNDGEAAYYVWEGLDESSTFTWHNYLKDWALTVDWPWRARNE